LEGQYLTEDSMTQAGPETACWGFATTKWWWIDNRENALFLYVSSYYVLLSLITHWSSILWSPTCAILWRETTAVPGCGRRVEPRGSIDWGRHQEGETASWLSTWTGIVAQDQRLE